MLCLIPQIIKYAFEWTILWITSAFIHFFVTIFPVLRRILKGEFAKVDVLIFHRYKQTLLRRHWDIQINDNKFFGAVAGKQSLGLGEAYVNNWWESPNLQDTLFRIVKGNMDAHPLQRWRHNVFLDKYNNFNFHTPKIALEMGKKFYDKHNAVFKIMLDPSMTYSSAYWAEGVKDLESAQRAKMELVARKLKLSPGMKILDLGCGYGGFMKYLAQTHKVSLVGVTVSEEEAKYARESCAGLDVEVVLADYRDFLKKRIKLGECFDRVVSIDMLEHVGHAQYREFFKFVYKVLKDEGLVLIESLGQSERMMPLADPWICENVLKNLVFPYVTMIPEAVDGLFILDEWQNLGEHFYNTFNAWIDNFHLEFHRISGKIENAEEFHRKWSYFLQSAASALRARKLQCWQIVFSKGGAQMEYDYKSCEFK